MTFSTTIKKEWWERKIQQYDRIGYFYEYKEHKPYWNKRIENLKLPADAVFLVGAVPYRATITEILRTKMYDIPTDIAYFFFLKNRDPYQTAEEFKNGKVWVLKCENVRGETEEKEAYTNEEKKLYLKFDEAQKGIDKEVRR